MIRGRPNVYTTDKSRLDFMKTTAWDIVDKFVFIPNIEDVDRMDITSGGARPHASDPEDDEESREEGRAGYGRVDLHGDGKKAEEESFKNFYQPVIGLQVEGEATGHVPDRPDMSVKFYLNKGPSKTVTVDYAPYDSDFYAVFLDGRSEFALTKQQLGVDADKARHAAYGRQGRLLVGAAPYFPPPFLTCSSQAWVLGLRLSASKPTSRTRPLSPWKRSRRARTFISVTLNSSSSKRTRVPIAGSVWRASLYTSNS